MILNSQILRRVSAADRAKMGKAGQLPEETLAKSVAKSEKELQSQIASYLRLKGIEPLWHRTDKKSAATIGWPDITFCFNGVNPVDNLPQSYACAFECKMPGKFLSKEQTKMAIRMLTKPNGWWHSTITHLDQVIEFLRERGIE